MVYGVVKQSGGYIAAYSEMGKGTTFKIYLPQVAETAETGVSKKPQQHRKQGSETILLVEDDAAVRDLVSAMLTAQGYTVLVSQQAQDAGTICERHSGRIHLLITDMVLPGMSGREIAKRVGSLRPECESTFHVGVLG